MKAKRIKWEEMWEKYFENYVGWTTMVCGKSSSSSSIQTENNITTNITTNISTNSKTETKTVIDEPVNEVSGELYYVHEPEILTAKEEEKIRKKDILPVEDYDINSFLNAPIYDTSEKYYPADEYMGSEIDESVTDAEKETEFEKHDEEEVNDFEEQQHITVEIEKKTFN